MFSILYQHQDELWAEPEEKEINVFIVMILLQNKLNPMFVKKN